MDMLDPQQGREKVYWCVGPAKLLTQTILIRLLGILKKRKILQLFLLACKLRNQIITQELLPFDLHLREFGSAGLTNVLHCSLQTGCRKDHKCFPS